MEILTNQIFIKETDVSKLDLLMQTLFPQYDLSDPRQVK